MACALKLIYRMLNFLLLFIDAGSDHLRVVFGQQMGLSDQDIVALSGGHTLVSMIPWGLLANSLELSVVLKS